MEAKFKNDWIKLPNKKNGLDVYRCYAGVSNNASVPDSDGYSTTMEFVCKYHYRELYPDGTINKEETKSYNLEDLAETVVDEANGMYMPELRVLTQFIDLLGRTQIIDRVRATLGDDVILVADAPNNYPLHLNTREILTKQPTT